MSVTDRSPVVAWLRAVCALPPLASRTPVATAIPVVVFALVAALLALLAPAMLHDPDTLWHVFIGHEILTTHALPQRDAWSWTMAGTPWIAKEWLSQVLFALAYDLGGWPAVTTVAAVAVALAFALLAREALSRLDPVTAAVLVVAVFPLAAGHLLARPHVLAWAPMVAWTVALIHAAEAARPPRLAALALITLWANLHGSFLLGLASVPVFAVEALLRAAPSARAGLAGRWAAFLAAAIGASLIHPYGFGVLKAALDVLGLDGAGLGIAEWKPTDFTRIGPMEVALLGGIAALALTGRRIGIVRAALLLGLAHMALAHTRHMAIFGWIGALALIEPLAVGRIAVETPAPRRGVVALAVAAALAALATQFGRADVVPDETTRPAAALAAVRAAAVPGAVFNEYGFGGWLITEGVPTYVDGRTELFGRARVATYLAAAMLTDAAALDRILADPRIGWTLLPPGLPAVAVIDRTPGWRRLHSDDRAIVHVRTP